MQKVLRQNLLARNQKLKVARREDLHKFKDARRKQEQQALSATKAAHRQVKDERKHRREDWMLGPLAPNRNVGREHGVYGSISPYQYENPDIPKKLRAKFFNFAVGDRAVVVRGPYRGQIAKVKEVDHEKQEVTLDGLNKVDIPIPDWDPTYDKRKSKIASINLGFSVDAVRLIHAIYDPEKKQLRDTVVRYMEGGPPFLARGYGDPTPTHTRYIVNSAPSSAPGGSTKSAPVGGKIPWPRDPQIAEYSAQDCDTPRMAVEEHTYIPSIGWGPMPLGCIDELRTPFRRGREQHNEEWVVQKVEQDARESWTKTRRIATPQQLKWEHDRATREGVSEEISTETRALIGKEMRQTRREMARARRELA